MNAHIESAFLWQQLPPTLHQSETCYVHHSLADIDTKKLLTGKINQIVGWPDCNFFQDWSKLLFLQKFDGRVAELKLTDGGSNWRLTQCESLCFFFSCVDK